MTCAFLLFFLELAITINLKMRAYPCELSALINKLAQPAKTIFTDFDVFQENNETRLL